MERDGIVPREFGGKAGEQGLLCANVPTAYGRGGGLAFHVVVIEELWRAGVSGRDPASWFIPKWSLPTC